MDRVAGLAFGINLDVFKEPRGFLRAILLFLAIFAFATTVDPSTSSKFSVKCNSTLAESTYMYSYKYPFNLNDDSTFKYKMCFTGKEVTLSPCCNYNSGPQFYVFIGVMAFLFSLASLVVYVFFDDKWRNMDMIPIVDCVVAAVFGLFFLIASSVWASSLADIKHYTDPEELFIRIITDCKEEGVTCKSIHTGNFATLNVSVIFGFLNMCVWCASVWFLFKDTRYHKEGIPSQFAASFSPPKTATPPATEDSPESNPA